MFKTVLVPVDITEKEEATRLLAAAQSLTADWDCTLHVATITPDFGKAIVGSYFDADFETETRARVEQELSALLAETGIAAQTHVLSGTIYDRIIGLAARLNTDLIVIGAHRPDLRDYLLGSNAARMVRHSQSSVLVLRDT